MLNGKRPSSTPCALPLHQHCYSAFLHGKNTQIVLLSDQPLIQRSFEVDWSFTTLHNAKLSFLSVIGVESVARRACSGYLRMTIKLVAFCFSRLNSMSYIFVQDSLSHVGDG